ncbi:hypothetical protein GP486_003040, partial [Trichoglossum hirsutum]
MLSPRIIRALANSALLGGSAATCKVCLNRFKSPNVLASLGEARFASSSGRWRTRQSRDRFTKEAKIRDFKSRAAFKLLEMDAKFKIFKKGQTVVDLVRQPAKSSHTAALRQRIYNVGICTRILVADRTSPNGRVIGVDIIPAQPPRGVSTIQGNFLSPAVQESVRHFLLDPDQGRAGPQVIYLKEAPAEETAMEGIGEMEGSNDDPGQWASAKDSSRLSRRARDESQGKMVDVVLSDMSAPWPQNTNPWKRSLSVPYLRMMNTSGINFRDHAGSMDLCNAALQFSFDTLRSGGHFICKFYQGAEDELLESRLMKLFQSVHREKPESSRS